MKLSLGFPTYMFKEDMLSHITTMKLFQRHYSEEIYDIHLPHYDFNEIASGRMPNKISKKTMLGIVEQGSNMGIKMTLLINYLLHKDYDLVVKILRDEYIPRGLSSVVVADIEMIKRIKDALPQLEIQGSCLSYRLTAEDLEEERLAGVTLHNPSVNIIRDVENLKRNHELGYKQKIIWSEGCLHCCPSEIMHRDAIARGGDFKDYCSPRVLDDMKLFYKANWVTVKRLKELSPYIDVVKMPRGTIKTDSPQGVLGAIRAFLHIYDNDIEDYNILGYNGVAYRKALYKKYTNIPAYLFDTEFFTKIDSCNNQCADCGICTTLDEKLKGFLR